MDTYTEPQDVMSGESRVYYRGDLRWLRHRASLENATNKRRLSYAPLTPGERGDLERCNQAWLLYEQGKGVPVQRRLGERFFEYIFQARAR